jgi:hypothetical protein
MTVANNIRRWHTCVSIRSGQFVKKTRSTCQGFDFALDNENLMAASATRHCAKFDIGERSGSLIDQLEAADRMLT